MYVSNVGVADKRAQDELDLGPFVGVILELSVI
jgi:hypothetical protein